MAGAREIKRRIRSVNNTKQITKAMKMVAAAKLRRAQDQAVASKPYANKLQEVLGRIVEASGELKHPLLDKRATKNVGYIIVSADRGLAGGYNANLIRKAVQVMAGKDNVGVVTVGRKARDFFKKRNYNIQAEYLGINDVPSFAEASKIADTVVSYYEEGIYDEVYLVYTEFVTTITLKPVVKKLLPIETLGQEEESKNSDYLFEPQPEEVLNTLLPRYLKNSMYSALMNSKASEHAARMTAMDSATDNASEMIDKLTLFYNRARQAAITREISEIVAGANAL